MPPVPNAPQHAPQDDHLEELPSQSNDTDSDLDLDDYGAEPPNFDSEEDSNDDRDLTPEQHLLTNCVRAGLSRPAIVDHMVLAGFPMSLATVGRRLQELDLSTAPPRLSHEHRQQAIPLLHQCHRLGFSRTEALDHLRDAYHIPITFKILKTISRQIGINWRQDDLQAGRITRAELTEIMQMAIAGEDADAGYRCLQAALAIRQIRVRRSTVIELMHEIDPEGVALRRQRALKRRRFFTHGSNYIWSSDGHDKLKPFGIAIYGCVDAWSRKVLSFEVGVNNSDPRWVAYHYLHTVRRIGGIPVQTCTDHGTETVHMAALQVYMTAKYANEPMQVAQRAHMFTTSPRNQKIESLWSLLRRRKGKTLQRFFQDAIDSGIYNPEDPLEKYANPFLTVHKLLLFDVLTFLCHTPQTGFFRTCSANGAADSWTILTRKEHQKNPLQS